MSEQIFPTLRVAYSLLHEDGRLAVITVRRCDIVEGDYEGAAPDALKGYGKQQITKLLSQGYSLLNWNFLKGPGSGLLVKTHKFRVT